MMFKCIAFKHHLNQSNKMNILPSRSFNGIKEFWSPSFNGSAGSNPRKDDTLRYPSKEKRRNLICQDCWMLWWSRNIYGPIFQKNSAPTIGGQIFKSAQHVGSWTHLKIHPPVSQWTLLEAERFWNSGFYGGCWALEYLAEGSFENLALGIFTPPFIAKKASEKGRALRMIPTSWNDNSWINTLASWPYSLNVICDLL